MERAREGKESKGGGKEGEKVRRGGKVYHAPRLERWWGAHLPLGGREPVGG